MVSTRLTSVGSNVLQFNLHDAGSWGEVYYRGEKIDNVEAGDVVPADHEARIVQWGVQSSASNQTRVDSITMAWASGINASDEAIAPLSAIIGSDGLEGRYIPKFQVAYPWIEPVQNENVSVLAAFTETNTGPVEMFFHFGIVHAVPGVFGRTR